jgi:uncharacterized BrkB/YihY/UPF0761 family membrane protein
MSAKQASARVAEMREEHAAIDVGFRAIDRDLRVAAMVLAGGIAYRFLFWVLAVSVVAGGVLGFFDPSAAEDAARDHGIGAGLSQAISAVANSAAGDEWWLIPLGVWLLLWTGYMAAKALVLTHASVWNVPPPKMTRRFLASLLFTGGALGFVASLAGARWVREESTSWGLVTTLLVFALPFGAWLLASHLLPNTSGGWIGFVPGAVLLAVGLQAMHLFTVYFLGPKLNSATELYGVVGIVTTVLFWFYITGRLIIGSATLNAAFSEQRIRAQPNVCGKL